MSSEPLAARLRALSSELRQRASLDAATRRLAADLHAELERLLGAGTAASPASAGSLEALAIRFDTEHPAMSAALRQVADLLGKAGI